LEEEHKMKKLIFGILFLALFVSLPICEGAETSVQRAYNDSIRPSDGMIADTSRDHYLDVSENLIEEETTHHAFGLAPAGIQITATDVWDRADASATQQTYIAPTAARIHQIVSSSTSDDGDPAGVGARTARVFGLTSWTTPEITEDITMNGTSNVATTHSFVFINKIVVLTKGATNVNVGAITATADSDSTVSAVILAGEGETHMGIMAISSLEDAYLSSYHGGISKGQASASTISYTLKYNPEPADELLNFVNRLTRDVQSTGKTFETWPFDPPLRIAGPAIIKVSGIASQADLEGSGGFSLTKRTDTSGFTVLMDDDLRVLTDDEGRVFTIEL
jgi:hypothetical protein